MSDPRHSSRGGVLPIIRSVRTRWRLRMALRGASIVLAVAFAAFLLSAFGLEATRFSPAAVTALRFAAWSVVALFSVHFLLRPLLRRVSDEQVALYLEEHEPSLEAALLGAVSVQKGPARTGGSGRHSGSGSRADSPSSEAARSPKAEPSAALLDLLVQRAVEKARAVEYGRRIDRPGMWRGSGFLAAVVSAIVLFVAFGPNGLRYGMGTLVLPTTEAAEVSPYSIVVSPGDVAVARGADQLITADLVGFDADEVYFFSRVGEGEPSRQLTMLPADSGRYDLLLLNLTDATEYFVEANGVRSQVYTIEVADLPYVGRMSHTYTYPAYTGLSPRLVEDAGDIATLAGTRVSVVVEPTIPTPAGRLLLGDSGAIELIRQSDGTLAGDLRVRRDGVYRIELAREDGRMVSASPDYTIDVLADLPPSVSISRPGRDQAASAIEEIFIEARADDDYGIGNLDLVYSVNGQPEDTVALFSSSGPPLPEVSAGHTLFLEEWELDPGDVISYYALARDTRDGRGTESMSDIYFVNVRPFRRDFRQAEAQQGGGQPPAGSAGRQGGGGSLSELQREVVAATFNLLRDRDLTPPQEFSENAVTVALAQGRVRDEVANLLVQMTTRGVAGSDPHFQEIARLLPEAVADMEAAEARLREEEPREALAPEQRALTVLQKAEETYERFVGRQQQGGGGGSGGEASADELADLFELELDRLQNQYETVQRGERQQTDDEVDELMERLKELARRQQQEMDRQRARAEAGQAGGQGGAAGDSQRSLAEETEETARQLAELSRRTGDRELAETARRLQEAAESMRRSASGSRQNRGLADATSALDDLEEAQRRLERAQEDRMQEGILNALDRVDRLARDQGEVRGRVEELPESPFERGEEVDRIHEMKDAMAQEAQALERDLVRMQQGAQRENREAAGKLGEAVETMREGRLREKLAYTKGVVEQREREFALQWEDQIAEDIEALRERVEDAARAYEEGLPDQALEEALEEARDLVRGTESLERRLQGGGQAETPGSEGDLGQAEAEGQRGSEVEGRSGEPGRRGGEVGEVPGRGRQGRETQDSLGQPGGVLDPERGGGGGATRGAPEPFSPEEIRQFTREFGQRLAQARDLQERLEASGREASDLEDAIEAMEALGDPEVYGDLPQIASLQEQIRESLRRLEFSLRREVEGEDRGRAALGGSDEVPAGFRELVEEYFRNLARGGRGGGGS